MADLDTRFCALVDSAIDIDNAALLNEALSMVPAQNLEECYSKICYDAIRGDSIAILRCLIDHGMSVKHLDPGSVAYSPPPGKPPSKAVLELLLARGWDIKSGNPPFLWFMVRYTDMVAWCLEHGASVIPSSQEFNRSGALSSTSHCDPILDWVATSGTVAAFELLRSKGAPLGQRTLHRAVEAATVYGLDCTSNPEKDTETKIKDRVKFTDRVDMVRHLLDVVRLDVNAPDRAPGCTKGMSSAWGTPLSYVVGAGEPDKSSRELTWLLLDRGADPAPALELEKMVVHRPFVEDVKVWMERNSGRPTRIDSHRSCCMQ